MAVGGAYLIATGTLPQHRAGVMIAALVGTGLLGLAFVATLLRRRIETLLSAAEAVAVEPVTSIGPRMGLFVASFIALFLELVRGA